MKTTLRSWSSACAALLLLPVYMGCAHAQSTPRPPEFTVDPTWPTIPNNWVLGEVTSISVDRNDNIWVLHVPQSIPEAQRANAAPPVLQFDAAGKLLTSWGGPGNGAEWLGREHGIFVDADDFVWIGGRAGWPRATTPGSQRRHDHEVHDGRRARHADRPPRAEHRQSRHGQTSIRPPTSSSTRRRTRSTSPTATATSASSSSTRRPASFKRMWGAFGNPPPSTFAANAPTPQPQTTPDGPPEFGLPHAIKVSRDGVVYLADRINNRIQLFTRDGKFMKQVRVTNEGSDVVPVPAGFAFSPDREAAVPLRRRLRADARRDLRSRDDDADRRRRRAGQEAGEFDIVHHMAADSKGNLYTAEIVNNRRAQKFVPAATR